MSEELLFKAVQKQDMGAAEALLASVEIADVNWKNYSYYNRTAIFLAVINGDIQMTTLLIKYGTDLKICDKNGETVLHVALRHGEHEIASLLLLDNDALEIINKKNDDGNTPLMVGVGMISQDTRLLSMLIDKGADISIENNEGNTALSIAQKYRKESNIISMLKEYSIGKI
jgi:ankyrin repeat protein